MEICQIESTIAQFCTYYEKNNVIALCTILPQGIVLRKQILFLQERAEMLINLTFRNQASFHSSHKLLWHINQGLQKYCETAFSRSGINQMWILKNSKELLEHPKSPTFNHVTSIKSFDFSTLYTTIHHQKLKDRLTNIIRNAFIFKSGNRRYKYLVLGHGETYFAKELSDSKNKFSEYDIIKMLEILVDNIFVVFARKVFQQTVGIPMERIVPLFSSLCIHTKRISYSLCSQRERSI